MAQMEAPEGKQALGLFFLRVSKHWVRRTSGTRCTFLFCIHPGAIRL